jgi:membrane-bound inhibitor of C-type lysozyme
MTKKLNQWVALASLIVVLPACSSFSLNPFDSSVKEQSRTPQNAIAYECNEGKQFYVQMLNHGNDAWLIYPDHEVNLTKSTDNPNKFTSGNIALFINGNDTTLSDGEKIAYTGCKLPVKK